MINIISISLLLSTFIAVVVYLLRKFEYQAHHDRLTGLANRKHFEESFDRLKNRAHADGSNIGVVFIDVDKFKEINDSYGHDTGDAVLKSIAAKMTNHLKEKDLKARMGGDEFLVALADVSSKDEITEIAVRLIAKLNTPLSIGGRIIPITVSGGCSFYPDDADDLETLMQNADTAMYEEKRRK